MQPATFAQRLTHEMLSAEQHQARPRLLVVLAIGICSLFGLLGVYTSGRTLLTHQGGLRAEGGATCRKAQLLKAAEHIPRLLHRLELSDSGMLVYTAPGLITSSETDVPKCMLHEPGTLPCIHDYQAMAAPHLLDSVTRQTFPRHHPLWDRLLVQYASWAQLF